MTYRRSVLRGPVHWLLALVMATALLLAPSTAAAKSVSELAERLRNASDFRVKVQAALALGASQSDDAVAPLCAGLADSNATVRTAVAAGLGRLQKPGGLQCLKQRQSRESNASVKTQIAQSIKRIEDAQKPEVKPPDATSKWYVAIAKTNNKGDQGRNGDIDKIVQEVIRKTLQDKQGFAVAPERETSAQAQAVIQRHKLTAYYLQPTVEDPKYQDSKLTVTVRITMFSYPNKALQGEFAPKLTQSGTPTKDVASEDDLIKMAMERAMSRFLDVVNASEP